LGILPSEPPTKKTKLSTVATKRKALEQKAEGDGAGVGAGVGEVAGGGGAGRGAGVGAGRVASSMATLSARVKEFLPKMNTDYSLVPSHMANEHRLRPGVAPNYEHFTREQLVAEMTALGWKVKAKDTKLQMRDYLLKTWRAWRFRVKAVQQAKMEKAQVDKASIYLHNRKTIYYN
jgi:hypothetical protein